jgi:hypothetical protein
MKRLLIWLNNFIAVITKARRHHTTSEQRSLVTTPYCVCSADQPSSAVIDELVTELFVVGSPRARELWKGLLAAQTDNGRALLLLACIRELKAHTGAGIDFGYIKEKNCYGYYEMEERYETAGVR